MSVSQALAFALRESSTTKKERQAAEKYPKRCIRELTKVRTRVSVFFLRSCPLRSAACGRIPGGCLEEAPRGVLVLERELRRFEEPVPEGRRGVVDSSSPRYHSIQVSISS